tara:strand:- start:889 stop:1134 length:246 start_codon:yes stop_codon:yes gene_type:complete
VDNILTMKSGSRHTIGFNEQWVPKPQKEGGKQKGALVVGMGIHKRDGVYWFNNRKIKDLIAFCRREGLIVAPDCNLGPNDR